MKKHSNCNFLKEYKIYSNFSICYMNPMYDSVSVWWVKFRCVDPYIKILIRHRVIYESTYKKYVNVIIAVWPISNSFKKLIFWLIDSSLSN